jgi:hypothetical protein
MHFSKVALTATLAATLVLTPAALANEVEVDDVMLVDEDTAAGRDLLRTKPRRGRKHRKIIKPETEPTNSYADEGDEGNEGDEGASVFPLTKLYTSQVTQLKPPLFIQFA